MSSVIFDGVKFFWRTRNTVDIVIVEHKEHEIFELIVYEPSFDVEAPRIYIDSKILMTKVDNDEIEAKLSFAKRNGVPLTEKFYAKVVHKVVSDYIMSRIFMKEFSTEEKDIVVELTNGDMSGVLNEKPEFIEEHKTKHYHRLMEGVVEQLLTVLKEERKELLESTDNAAELAGLNHRDRWRMPLVIGKVNRGERLNANDERIFNRVKANMKTDEDIARMKACMGMPLHSSRITPPRTTSLTRHTSNLSPKSNTSHSPKHTPAHSPRRSTGTERQSSLRRTPSNTFHLNTESSLRRTQENNGSITPTHSTKPKKHGKKTKKGAKRKNSSENNVTGKDGTTTADGEWEDEEDNGSVVDTEREKNTSFGLAGSFKSIVGSVKTAMFSVSQGSGSGITTVSTTRKEDYSSNITEEVQPGGKEREAGDKLQEEHTHKSKMTDTTTTPSASTPTPATTTVPIITTTNSAEQYSENKEEELAAVVRDRVKPTRRTSQLGSFLSALTTSGGIAATALGSLMKGWGTGTTTTTHSSSSKVVPME